MKKKIRTILIIGLMSLGLTGCKIQKNEFNLGKKSNIQITQNEVSMSIKEGTLTNSGATLVLTNKSNKNFQYGNPYEIEMKKEEDWYKINVELDFTLPAFSLEPKKSKEIKVNWKEGYGNLASGTYRIIKGIDYEKEEGNFETFAIAAEFTIE